MPLSRRQFTTALATGAGIAVVGCSHDSLSPPTRRFGAGDNDLLMRFGGSATFFDVNGQPRTVPLRPSLLQGKLGPDGARGRGQPQPTELSAPVAGRLAYPREETRLTSGRRTLTDSVHGTVEVEWTSLAPGTFSFFATSLPSKGVRLERVSSFTDDDGLAVLASTTYRVYVAGTLRVEVGIASHNQVIASTSSSSYDYEAGGGPCALAWADYLAKTALVAALTLSCMGGPECAPFVIIALAEWAIALARIEQDCPAQ